MVCVMAAGAAIGFSSAHESGDATAVRQGVRRYLAEPAVVYPICISRTDRTYAKVGVYPVPVNYASPFQVLLHRSGRVWRVVAFRDYDSLGWLSDERYPKALAREPWCHAVPHTPAAIHAALTSKLAVVSTFGMTLPYVPVIGPPLYKPRGLGYSVDGGAIYSIKKWLFYGKQSARARATWEYNPCTPDCATGKPRTLITFVLTLTDPKPCRDVPAYTNLTVSQSSNRTLFPDTSRSLRRFCS
jgi:hypothetical protein